MVEDRQLADHPQNGVGITLVVGGHIRETLDLAHDVVADIAGHAPVERRQLRQRRRPVHREQPFQGHEQALIARDRGREVAVDIEPRPAGDDRRGGATSHEREPAPTLALDRLE